MFWVPRSGRIGLGVSILSYNDNVIVGIASDEGLMPDPEVLLEGFEDEFNHLLELVQSGKIDDEPLVLHDRYEEAQASAQAQESKLDRETAGAAVCTAMTKSGRRCKNRAIAGARFCRVHRHQVKTDNRLKDVAQIVKELSS
jgi:hypothetical protein